MLGFIGCSCGISCPENSLHSENERSDDKLFLAGGVGIAPIIPMLLETEYQGIPWKLFYCNRCLANAPFVEDLTRLGGAVKLHI